MTIEDKIGCPFEPITGSSICIALSKGRDVGLLLLTSDNYPALTQLGLRRRFARSF